MKTVSNMGLVALTLALAAGTGVAATSAPDIKAGETIFHQRCQMCHVIAPGVKGTMAPNLSGVVGRAAASTDYRYSPALKAAGLKWDRATLDKFLAAPGKMVPGTRMVYSVPDAQQRANVVAYLASLKK